MAAQIPDSSIKSVSVGNVTEADIAEFQRGTSQADILPGMMSGREFEHMDSVRYDGGQRGFNTGEPQVHTQEPVIVGNDQMNQPATRIVYNDSPQEPINYQQRYGQSENEKGEWRRLAQETGAQNAALAAQLAEISNRLSQAPQMQPQPQTPIRLFPTRDPNEIVNFGELEQIFRDEVLPALQVSELRSSDIATARAQRMLPGWDVQPQEETQALQTLRNQFSNFDNRFTATEKNAMLVNQVAVTRTQSGNNVSQRPTAIPVGRVVGTGALANGQVQYIDPNRAMRRATYVESSAPTQTMADPTSTTDPRQRFAQELQALDQAALASTGRRATAKQMEQLFTKFGVPRVNDWGMDTLPR